MSSRTIETILTGRNLLSPVLREAGRDVTTYNQQVEAANTRASSSANSSAEAQRTAAGKVAAANTQMAQSVGEAARRIIELRGRLGELRDRKVDVDVDVAAARSELDALRVQLMEVVTGDPTVQVQADTAAASAQLQAIQSELSRIDGQTVTARVVVEDGGSVGRATSGMGGLASAALMVSPALSSIGAVAVAGIGAIGPLAIGAAAGLGVLALGASGVSDTVKLLGQRQEAAATAAASSGASQVASAQAVAAAQRGLESAEASLANVRANAADAAVKAAASVQRAKDAEVAAELDAAAKVNDTLQALTDAREDAARKVGDAEQRLADVRERTTGQVEAALDRYAAAEASASQSVENAIDQQIRAERALTDAQRDQQQAQEDLTQARRDAEDQLEDLANQVTGNALSQEQSVLDVAEAQERLNKTIADPKATDRQRAQAELSYRQTLQRQRELQVQGRRLAEEQAAADEAGVEGSELVTDAERRLLDAKTKTRDADREAEDAAQAVTDARVKGADDVSKAEAGVAEVRKRAARDVADTERSLADARIAASRRVADAEADVVRAREDGAERVLRAQQAVTDAVAAQVTQQRQSAFSVSQAQAGVVSAMAAVAAASTSAGGSGSAALAKIDAELAKVDPATRRFADYVKGTLQPAFDGLQGTAAAGLLPGVQAAVENLMPYLPELDRFVGGLASTMGDLAIEGSRALTSPFWLDFFRMIDENADPILQDFVRTLGNTGTGFAGIITAFMPMSRDVSTGILDLSRDFSLWGQNLQDSPGFKNFVAYVQENWPKVREIIGNVADMVGNLIEAGAPIGGAYLTGFVLLTDVLAGLPVGVVQALLVALLGYRAVSGVLNVIDGLAGSFGRMSTQINGLPDKVSALSGSMGSGAGKVNEFGIAAGGASGALSKLARAAGVGGAAFIAIEALGAAFGQSATELDRFAAKTEALGGPSVEGQIKSITDEIARQQKVVDEAAISWEFWGGGIFSNDQARDSADRIGVLSEKLAALKHQKELDAIASGQAAAGTRDLTGAIKTQGTTYELMVGSASGQLDIYQQLLQDKADQEVASAAATGASLGGSTNSWQRHVADAAVSLSDYAAHLDADVAKKDEWREDIKVVTERGGAEVGAALLAMGQEGAALADQLANSTDEDFRRMADSMINHARNGGAAAAWEIEQATKIMSLKSREGSKLTAQAIAEELQIGVRDAARIAAEYGIELAAGINPLLQGLGKDMIITADMRKSNPYYANRAEGGVIDYYAHGGVESHVAEIAPAGQWRVWAEPETGGEAYIPLSPAKRARSMEIWRETGRRLDAPESQYFAFGGISDVPRPRSTAPYGVPISSAADATMQRSFAEVQAWLMEQANSDAAAQHGPAAGGALFGGTQGIYNAVKAVFPWAILTSGYRPGDPGYHGRRLAADIGAPGNNPARLAEANRWLYDHHRDDLAELIYDGRYDDRPDVKNYRDHIYNAATRADHDDHVHAAVPRADGGRVWPDQLFRVGEHGEELVTFDRPGTVIPADQSQRLMAPASVSGYRRPVNDAAAVSSVLAELARIIAQGNADAERVLAAAADAMREAVAMSAAKGVTDGFAAAAETFFPQLTSAVTSAVEAGIAKGFASMPRDTGGSSSGGGGGGGGLTPQELQREAGQDPEAVQKRAGLDKETLFNREQALSPTPANDPFSNFWRGTQDEFEARYGITPADRSPASMPGYGPAGGPVLSQEVLAGAIAQAMPKQRPSVTVNAPGFSAREIVSELASFQAQQDFLTSGS